MTYLLFFDSPLRPGEAHPSPLYPLVPVLARPVCHWLREWAGENTTLEAGTTQSAQLIWQKAMEKVISFFSGIIAVFQHALNCLNTLPSESKY